ncbi:hypothetical protein [Pelagicoccus sp. SDUM812003]|uniref:hypothetical protein n=1 Tax=Pelagicoccus sp. SDUM812003 TaxID=3041267 RepID=UPI00280DA910|nr:hypothetical protein [Pelagicoccus sp. SDUM812003]MDQ8201785.1 hypothetical protein [Pelagicoccus sp. SDUM812003]
MSKDDFVEILQNCGITEQQMESLHRQMEQRFPDSHLGFLKFLRIEDKEIERIRRL